MINAKSLTIKGNFLSNFSSRTIVNGIELYINSIRIVEKRFLLVFAVFMIFVRGVLQIFQFLHEIFEKEGVYVLSNLGKEKPVADVTMFEVGVCRPCGIRVKIYKISSQNWHSQVSNKN